MNVLCNIILFLTVSNLIGADKASHETFIGLDPYDKPLYSSVTNTPAVVSVKTNSAALLPRSTNVTLVARTREQQLIDQANKRWKTKLVSVTNIPPSLPVAKPVKNIPPPPMPVVTNTAASIVQPNAAVNTNLSGPYVYSQKPIQMQPGYTPAHIPDTMASYVMPLAQGVAPAPVVAPMTYMNVNRYSAPTAYMTYTGGGDFYSSVGFSASSRYGSYAYSYPRYVPNNRGGYVDRLHPFPMGGNHERFTHRQVAYRAPFNRPVQAPRSTYSTTTYAR